MNNKVLTFFIDSAAVYRLTKLILEDRITEDLRERIWGHFPPETTKLGYLLACPWCVSIWAASVIYTTRVINPSAANYLSGILASSALTGVAFQKGL